MDEAQFFAPIWFEIIKRILTPDTGHLFLVADASQGFLKRGQSWLSSGLDVRGRSTGCKRVIAPRAKSWILPRCSTAPGCRRRTRRDRRARFGAHAQRRHAGVIPLTSPQDELTRVVNEIRRCGGRRAFRAAYSGHPCAAGERCGRLIAAIEWRVRGGSGR